MISLAYIVLTLLNSMVLPGQEELGFDPHVDSGIDILEKFLRIKQFKSSISLFQMTKKMKNFKFIKGNRSPQTLSILYNLSQFAKEIEQLGFDQVPNYARIKSYLQISITEVKNFQLYY